MLYRCWCTKYNENYKPSDIQAPQRTTTLMIYRKRQVYLLRIQFEPYVIASNTLPKGPDMFLNVLSEILLLMVPQTLRIIICIRGLYIATQSKGFDLNPGFHVHAKKHSVSEWFVIQIKYGLPYFATCPSMSTDPGPLNVPGWWDPGIRTNTGAGDTVLARHT